MFVHNNVKPEKVVEFFFLIVQSETVFVVIRKDFFLNFLDVCAWTWCSLAVVVAAVVDVVWLVGWVLSGGEEGWGV